MDSEREGSSHKRPRGSPTGATPSQARKKRVRLPQSTLVRKTLDFSNTPTHSRYVPSSAWSLNETKALVEFLLLHSSQWPTTTDPNFWHSVSIFVRDRAEEAIVRTGGACRTRVLKHLAKIYASPLDAERELFQSSSQRESEIHSDNTAHGSVDSSSSQPPRDSGSSQPPRASGSSQPPRASGSSQPPRASGSSQPPRASGSSQPPRDLTEHEPLSSRDLGGAQRLGSNRVDRERHRVRIATQPVQSPQLEPSLQIGAIDTLRCQLSSLTTDEQLHLCGELLSQICSSQPAPTAVPRDFLSLSLKAMDNLKESGRRNVLYELALGLGSLRPDGTPLFPTDRMPMGLLEYMINFFASSNISEMESCPKDYLLWLESMYTLFGNKWAKLHRGPMWGSELIEQGIAQHHGFIPSEARVNIPAPSDRLIRTHIAASSFSTTSEIQIAVLEEGKRVHPNAQWWIKADGCDLVEALGESVDGDWSGDVDLNDGEVARQHSEYTDRLSHIEDLCKDLTNRDECSSELGGELSQLHKDMEFVSKLLQETNSEYENQVTSGHAVQKTLYGLAWKVKDLDTLLGNSRKKLTSYLIFLELPLPI